MNTNLSVSTTLSIPSLKTHMKNLVGTRWGSSKELETHLHNMYNLTMPLYDIDESELVNDYAFLIGIFGDYGYIDIYYLKVPYGETKIYITEINVCEE